MYNLLKRLSSKHTITLVSFIRDEKERSYKNDLSFCEQVYMVNRGRAWQVPYIARALFTRMPFLLSTYANAKMYRLLTKVLATKAFDLIHLEPFYVWPSIPNTRVPIVVSEHNIEYQVYEEYVRKRSFLPLRFLLMIDVSRLKRWEHYVWRKADMVTAVSQKDQRVMESYLSFPVSVVSNGVDTESFTFPKHKKEILQNFLFVGNFRWLPNIEAVERLLSDIWPRIAESFPKSTLTIVGRNMPENVLAALTGRIIGKTDVSDIRDEYNAAFALLAPMTIAGGTKFKVLEAMASGVPVVSTRAGVEGIDCEDEKHVLIANTPHEFVDKLARLVSDHSHREKVVKAARTLVEREYNWDSIAKTLDTVWRTTHEKKR